MKLQNVLNHMKNAAVRVCGVSYKIDDQGVIDIDDQEAIEKLLQNEAWHKVNPRQPVQDQVNQIDKPDYAKMSKSELINLCRYKQLNFKSTMKKDELVELLEKEG